MTAERPAPVGAHGRTANGPKTEEGRPGQAGHEAERPALATRCARPSLSMPPIPGSVRANRGGGSSQNERKWGLVRPQQLAPPLVRPWVIFRGEGAIVALTRSPGKGPLPYDTATIGEKKARGALKKAQ